ncbi:putative traG protein [Acinetobacter baumannii 24845_10]|nr:putative traG protein [Acinetobacter baumannii 24845_10]
MDFTIETYWNVESTYLILNAVASLMGSSDWVGALKFIFLTAIMASLFVFALDRDLGKFVRNFGWAYFIVVIIMAPVSSVAVVDKLKQEPPKIVGNVPWLLAMGAFTTNFTTGWITKEYETLTSVPSSLSLTGTGDMGFGQALIRNTNKMSITSPSLRADIMQYIKECSIYDMQDGVLNAEDLMQKTDSWNKLFSNTNPARFVTLGILKGAPETVTCVEGATRLKQQVNDGIAAAMRYYGKNAFIDFNEATALSMYTNAV